jgi:ribosomal protein L40E
MYCSKCGYELADGTSFCRKCGSKIFYNNLISKEKKSPLTLNTTSKEDTTKQNTIKETKLNEINTKKNNHKGFIALGILVLLLSIGFGSYYISIKKFPSNNSKHSEATSTENKVIPNDNTTNKDPEIKKDVAPTKDSNDISNIDSPTYYIFPESGSEKLLDSDVSKLKKEHLTLARNEIYARHGLIFKTEVFKNYFSKKTWYKPNSNFKGSDGELNDVEIYNIQLIKKSENN